MYTPEMPDLYFIMAICGACWNKGVSPSSAGSGRVALVPLGMGLWRLLTIDHSSMFLLRRGRCWLSGGLHLGSYTLRMPLESLVDRKWHLWILWRKMGTGERFRRRNRGRRGMEGELSPFPEYLPALLESWNCYSSSQCHPFCFRWRNQQ